MLRVLAEFLSEPRDHVNVSPTGSQSATALLVNRQQDCMRRRSVSLGPVAPRAITATVAPFGTCSALELPSTEGQSGYAEVTASEVKSCAEGSLVN